ncbi:MAG TPA: HD domain-containing phosphohydrolase [Vicinamibacteria bacterium]|nr:HD domain-containing phosphohydrolase [Vicinamibacteria bacterium]
MADVRAPRRRGRILFSILLLLFAVGLLPLIYLSWDLVGRSRESIESTQQEWQLDKAKLISAQVAIYVAGLRSQVSSIARTLEIDAAPGSFPRRVEQIRGEKALARYLQSSDNLVYLSVADITGNGTWSGLDLRDARLTEQREEAFQRGQHGAAMISVPIVSESLQEPVVVLGEPVFAGQPVAGVVLAVASLQPIRAITSATGGRLFEVYVVDNRGRLVAHSDPKMPMAADMSAVEIVRIFMRASEDSGRMVGSRRSGAFGTTAFQLAQAGGRPREMIGTFMRVPDDSGWGVIVQSDVETAYFTAIDLRRQSLKVAAAVAALAVGLGFLFAGQISRPVQKLAEGARRLAGGDYGTRVAVESGNEVGVLADAFNQMGEEIQKAILEIQRRAEENKELFMGSIRMLANAIDEKDPYTRGHSERVAYYSACTAKHLGMTAEEVERVHLSGIIHDVGKIGIEDKILRKAAALTDEEYGIMKQHPTKGEHILDAVPLLKEKAGDGLMHHENVDGSGYPRGLHGEDIPLLGRIVSVADAFDAMTTDRPYSKAVAFEDAVARLKSLAGRKFDPACVAAFERAFLSGDVSPAKARRASVASRHFDIKELVGEAPPAAAAAGTAQGTP